MSVPGGRIASAPDKKGVLLTAEAEAAAHVDRLREADYRVAKVESKETQGGPRPPLNASTLQQEAARKLRFGARKTMTLAQRLYMKEWTCPAKTLVGLITYMRTDSLTIAEAALREIAELVRTEFGAEYALSEPAPVQDEVAERAGGARSDPADVGPADARPGGRRPGPGPAPPVHTDLATDRGHADGAGPVQPGPGRHRRERGRPGTVAREDRTMIFDRPPCTRRSR